MLFSSYFPLFSTSNDSELLEMLEMHIVWEPRHALQKGKKCTQKYKPKVAFGPRLDILLSYW